MLADFSRRRGSRARRLWTDAIVGDRFDGFGAQLVAFAFPQQPPPGGRGGRGGQRGAGSGPE